MSTPTPAPITIDPPGAHSASVIWLHGLGADGNDFVPTIPHLGLPEDHGIRFIFPTAKAIPVTINGGMVMPAWYDILHLDLGSPDRNDVAGLQRSATEIEDLVQRESDQGISHDRIVLAGFSQGGAVALHLGTRLDKSLAGIMALSTYLVEPAKLGPERSPANQQTPILMCHGTFDPMVPVSIGMASQQALSALGYEVEWKTWPMQHEVCMEELEVIGRWLRERLP